MLAIVATKGWVLIPGRGVARDGKGANRQAPRRGGRSRRGNPLTHRAAAPVTRTLVHLSFKFKNRYFGVVPLIQRVAVPITCTVYFCFKFKKSLF